MCSRNKFACRLAHRPFEPPDAVTDGRADMLNTIRFGLIGGGEKPNIAASLARVYAAERPINEALPIAVAILETAFFGKPSRQELAVMALIKKSRYARRRPPCDRQRLVVLLLHRSFTRCDR
jgi:hypothetical protein